MVRVSLDVKAQRSQPPQEPRWTVWGPILPRLDTHCVSTPVSVLGDTVCLTHRM